MESTATEIANLNIILAVASNVQHTTAELTGTRCAIAIITSARRDTTGIQSRDTSTATD